MGRWIAARDSAVEAGLAALLVAVAAATVGVPDLRSAFGFLSGATSNAHAAGALVVALAWLLITALAALVALGVVRRISKPPRPISRTARAVALLAIAAAVLTVAEIGHAQQRVALCCADSSAQVQEALNLAH